MLGWLFLWQSRLPMRQMACSAIAELVVTPRRESLYSTCRMVTRRISFSVQGMFCARCATDLEHALAQRDGAIAASVNYASERAIVQYDPARVRPSAFVQIVKDTGFTMPLDQELELGGHQAVPLKRYRDWIFPTLAGFGGSGILLALYLGVFSLAQSPSHALEQMAQDLIWVGFVALGFGIQMGLYTYLRLVIKAIQLVGATALTGTGTTTSTVAMLACCVHHLADFAPLVALPGASGLSGVLSYLTAYKIPIILLGLVVNALGVVFTLRTIRRERTHLKKMEHAVPTTTTRMKACHPIN